MEVHAKKKKKNLLCYEQTFKGNIGESSERKDSYGGGLDLLRRKLHIVILFPWGIYFKTTVDA